MTLIPTNWACSACGASGTVSVDLRALKVNEVVRPLAEEHAFTVSCASTARLAHTALSPLCNGPTTGRFRVVAGRPIT